MTKTNITPTAKGSDVETESCRYKARDGRFYNGYCGSPDWAKDVLGPDPFKKLKEELMNECKDCNDIELCEYCQKQWEEAERDREFDERTALTSL